MFNKIEDIETELKEILDDKLEKDGKTEKNIIKLSIELLNFLKNDTFNLDEYRRMYYKNPKPNNFVFDNLSKCDSGSNVKNTLVKKQRIIR